MCLPSDVTIFNIGSNSLKILKVVDGVASKSAVVTRLGEGDGLTLTEGAIKRTLDAISANLAEIVGKVYAFATEAVRSASNRDDLLIPISQMLGVDVEVLSGEDEARYGYLGASMGRSVVVIDVGGASTEISERADAGVSVPLGAQRLRSTYGEDSLALEKIGRQTAENINLSSADGVVCIGGTITTLTSAILGQKIYDASQVHGARVTTLGLRVILDDLARMTDSQRVEKYPTMLGRESVIVSAGYYLVGLLEGIGKSEIEVSVLDVTEGYLFDKSEYIQKNFVFRQKNS
ncbi:MAG: hypothetical protein J6Q52_03035 [Clostridia bacterium]|nr:hypothetical protein [Clostridia bacterium]